MKKNRTIHRTVKLPTLVAQGFNPEATGLTITTPSIRPACSREGIVIFDKPGTVEYNLTNQSGSTIECGTINFDHEEYRLPAGKKLLVLSNGDWSASGLKWYENLTQLLPNVSPSESTAGTVTWDVVIGGTSTVINSECRKLSATGWITDKANSPLFKDDKLNFANYADNAGLTNDTVVIIRLGLDAEKTESLNKELSSLVKLRNLFLRKTKTVYVVTPLLGSWQGLITRNARYAQMIRDTFADNTIDVAMLGAPYTTGYYLAANVSTPQTSVVNSVHDGCYFTYGDAETNLGTAIIKCAAKKVIDSEL